LVCIHYDDEVARVAMGRVIRAVFTADNVCDLDRETANHLVGGVDDEPLPLDGFFLGHDRAHGTVSLIEELPSQKVHLRAAAAAVKGETRGRFGGSKLKVHQWEVRFCVGGTRGADTTDIMKKLLLAEDDPLTHLRVEAAL